MDISRSASPATRNTRPSDQSPVFGTLQLKILWPLYQLTVTAGSIGQIIFTIGSLSFLFLARNLAGVYRSHIIS